MDINPAHLNLSDEVLTNKSEIEDFGIVISCYKGDFFLTKGLLASIKTFLPQTPICIIQDGNFSLENEQEVYNIKYIIQKENVKSKFLKDTSFGTRCTAMIAFWESPFRYFLYIDSDTVIWGDILKNLKYAEYDFIHNTPHEQYTDYIIRSQYFNYERLFRLIPAIDLSNNHFFNAGVFFAKRGIFDIDKYELLYSLWKNDKTLFGPEPQGFINYLLFTNKDIIKVAEAQIQLIVPVTPRDKLETKFSICSDSFKTTQAVIIHWAGIKPSILNNSKVFSSPMLYFRKQNLIHINSIWRHFDNLALLVEELNAILYRNWKRLTWKRIKGKIKKIYFLMRNNKKL